MHTFKLSAADASLFNHLFNNYNKYVHDFNNETVIVTLSLPLYSIENVVG